MTEEIPSFYEVFYLDGMLYCCSSVESAFERLNPALKKIVDGAYSEDEEWEIKDIILCEAQNLIGHAASLSKYLWPPSKSGKYQRRGKKLRDALGVTEASPLKSRRVRNALEHFDEKLDDYLSEGMFGYIFPKWVDVKPTAGEPEHHLFRAFYIDVAEFEVLGENVPIQPLFDEVMDIGQKLVEFNSNGGRLPSD